MSQTDTLCIHSSNCMIQMHDCFGEKLSNHCRATYRVIHVDLGLPIAYKQGGSLTKEATNRARFSIDSYDICSTSYILHHAHLPRDRERSHVLHQIRGKANRIWNLQVEAFFVERRRNVRDFSSSHYFCLAAP
jgi:hypothetical protein